MHWFKVIKTPKPQKVFVVHGEEKQSMMVVDGLKQKLNLEGVMPEQGKVFKI